MTREKQVTRAQLFMSSPESRSEADLEFSSTLRAMKARSEQLDDFLDKKRMSFAAFGICHYQQSVAWAALCARRDNSD